MPPAPIPSRSCAAPDSCGSACRPRQPGLCFTGMIRRAGMRRDVRVRPAAEASASGLDPIETELRSNRSLDVVLLDETQARHPPKVALQRPEGRPTLGGDRRDQEIADAEPVTLYTRAADRMHRCARAHRAASGARAHRAASGARAHRAASGARAHRAASGARAHRAASGARAHRAASGGRAHRAASGGRAYTERPCENVSSTAMCSKSAGSAVNGFRSSTTRSACFPTVIEPLVSSSKYW